MYRDGNLYISVYVFATLETRNVSSMHQTESYNAKIGTLDVTWNCDEKCNNFFIKIKSAFDNKTKVDY